MRAQRGFICVITLVRVVGKAALMTRRLLALCFGSPVNAGRADGISPAKASLLSVYNNCCTLLSSAEESAHGSTGLRRLAPRQGRAGSAENVRGVLGRRDGCCCIALCPRKPERLQTRRNHLLDSLFYMFCSRLYSELTSQLVRAIQIKCERE